MAEKTDRTYRASHFFRRVLSYFSPQLLQRTKSKYNRSLEVSLVTGRIQLSPENAVYSFEDRYTSFLRSFESLKIRDRKIESVLVLGFGLGSIPLMLRKRFGQHAPVVGVEIDNIVIDLFDQYRDTLLSEKIEVICQDAYDYVNSSTASFDLVCVDLFIDDVVPQKFETTDFLENLKRAVIPDGLLLFNRMTTSSDLLATTETFRINHFEKVLEGSSHIDIGGNRMLVWEK